LLIACIYTLFQSIRARCGLKVVTTHYMFQMFLGTSMFLRLVWVALMGLSSPSNYVLAHEIVNRLVLLTSFTAYSFVVANWAEAIQWAPFKTRRWFRRPFVLFFIENLFFYGFEVVVLILRYAAGDSDGATNSHQLELTYSEEMLAASIVFLCHSFLFLWYGANVIILLYRAALLRDRRLSPTIRNIFLAATLCSVMTVIRFITFAWYPMTGSFFTGTTKEVMYPYFFYDVPEWVASGVLLYAFSASGAKGSLTRSDSVNEAVSSNPSDPSSTLLEPLPPASSQTRSGIDDRTLGLSAPRTPSLSLEPGRATSGQVAEDSALLPMGSPDDDDERQGGLRRWLLGMLGNR